MPLTKLTNEQFLNAVFGEYAPKAHVTAFEYDPDLIPADCHLKAWFGGYFERYTIADGSNQYFTISTFDPDEKGTARRRKALYKMTHCIVLDDVKEKLNLNEVSKLPAPSWILETSQGSEQWGYILHTPCTERHQVENLLDGLVKNGLAPNGVDPGMRGVTRYVRLPEGYNTKEKRYINGEPFKCKMLQWQPLNKVTMEQLAEPFNVDLNFVRREARIDGAAAVADHPLLDLVDVIRIKEVRSDGRFDITCPWVEEHTGADDSGSAVFTNADGTIGFKCHHGACQDRTGKHLLDLIEDQYKGFRQKLSAFQTMNLLADAEARHVAPLVSFMGDEPAPAVQTLEMLKVDKIPTENTDHLTSAKLLDLSVFDKRMVSMNGSVHWWSGRAFELVDESLIKRHIGNALAGAVSSGRVEGTYKLLLQHIDRLPDANPPEPKVFWLDSVMGLDGDTQPHNRNNHNSRTLAVNHTAAPPVEWLKFIGSVFAQGDGRAELLQEIMGWCLTRDNLNIQKMVMLVGKPRAGKGVVLDVLKNILNGGATSFNLDSSLLDAKQLSGLRFAHVAIDYDAVSPRSQDGRTLGGVLKRITANEPITIPLLYQQAPWTGSLNCKLMIAANSVPRFFDDSGALGGRWVPLVFNKSFLGKEDAGLPDRLNKELDSIASWAFAGLQRLNQNRRFSLPESSLNTLENIADDNPVVSFLNETVEINEDGNVLAKALYDKYKAYCSFNGHKPPSDRTFYNSVFDALPVTRKKTKRGAEFYGISDKHTVTSSPRPVADIPPPPIINPTLN